MTSDKQFIEQNFLKSTLVAISYFIIILGSLVPIFYFSINYMIKNFVDVSINNYILLGTVILLGGLFLIYVSINLISRKQLLEFLGKDEYSENNSSKRKFKFSNYFIKYTLIYFFYLTSFILTFISIKVIPDSYHQFTFIEILNGIIFLIWLLFGAFILDFYKVMRLSKTLTYFLIFCVLFSLIDLLVSSTLLSIPFVFYLIVVSILVIICDQNNKRKIQYYKDSILNKKSYNLVIIAFVLLSVLMQIFWSFSSPDTTAYYLTARNFIETGTLELFEPLLEYSDGFIRKLFYQSSELFMKTQYPIGGIYLLAFFMKNAIYWRILFVIVSIIFANQIIELYNNFYQTKPAPIHLFAILFLSEILIQLTTGYSVDIIGIIFSLIVINSFLNFINKNKKIEIVNLIAALVVLPLIKPVGFIFTLMVLFFVILYSYITNQTIKSKVKNLLKRRRNIILIVFASAIILSLVIWGLYFTFTGYLQQFNLLTKFIRPLQIPGRTFINFSVNISQLILIYFIFFIDFFIPKKIKEKYNIMIDKKQRNIIVIPLLCLFIVFIFFWNSSNFYPFDIASRYFILIGLVAAIFSNIRKYPKKLKIILTIYVVLTNGYFVIHAASLDHKNRLFAENVTNYLEESDIVVTNYYSKILPDNIVYFVDFESPIYEEISLPKIEFLLDNNFTIYFIPEGISSYDGVILYNFDYELVYEMERSWFERILFPKIGSLDLLNPAPRELYLLKN